MERLETDPHRWTYRLHGGRKQRRKTRKNWRLGEMLLICLHFPLIKYQKCLENLGTIIRRYPSKVIFLMCLISAFTCLGFLRIKAIGMQPNKLYTNSESSQLVKNQRLARRYFPEIDARREEIILMTKKEGNVLSRNCLKDALLVHKAVVGLKNFQAVCMRRQEDRTSQNNSCMMTNPLELCAFEVEEPSKCSEIIAREWSNSTILLSDGRSLRFGKRLLLAGLNNPQSSNNSYRAPLVAQAMRMTYYLKNSREGDPLENEALSWEARFVQQMKEVRSNLSCASLYFKSWRSTDEARIMLLSLDSEALFLSLAILFLTSVILSMCTMASGHAVAIAVGSVAAVCIAMALVSAVGIGNLFPIPFLDATWIVVIFLYCRGVGDAMVLTQSAQDQSQVPSIEHRITNCMTKAGLTLTISSMVSLVVYAGARSSSFPLIRELFFLALVSVPVWYILSLSLFVAFLYVVLERYRNDLKAFLPCSCKGESRNAEDSQPGTSIVMKFYGNLICSIPGSFLVLILFLGIAIGSTYLVLRNDSMFGSPLSLTSQDEVVDYENMKNEAFRDETQVKILVHGNVEYSDSTVRRQLRNCGKTLSNAPYSTRPIVSWIDVFEKWAERKHLNCSGSFFDECLATFQDDHASFAQDLHFDRQGDHRPLKLAATYFHLYMTSSTRLSVSEESLHSLQEDVSDFRLEGQSPLLIASHLLKETDQLRIVKHECLALAIVAGIGTLVISLTFTANPRVPLVLICGFAVQIVEILALLGQWGIPLNDVTLICVICGLIVSLSFCVQMSQVRSLSVETTAKQRTKAALNSAGMAVFYGILLTIEGSIALGYIFPNLVGVFHWVLPTHFVLTFVHALGFIPAILYVTSNAAEACVTAMTNEVSTFELSALSQGDPTEQLRSLYSHEQANRGSRPEGIAIVGISCRFPGAENKDQFWDMLAKGRCGYQEDYPLNRPEEYESYHALYHPKRFTPGKHCALGGAYLKSLRGFDAEFFNISSQEAGKMDPQQRILLQTVYEAIEDAGLRLEDLQKSSTGVFVGAMNLDYGTRALRPELLPDVNQFLSTGITASILANRISYCLNFTGPSLSVDTACSSSLVALKIACECLRSGECDAAIVCAPNIILDPATQVTFSIGGLLAPDGRCKAFDASGDGYGRGEGFAAIVIKPHDVAVEDKDDIYCEIIGCGMNNDGKSAIPITAPSAKTQAELSQRVLEESGVDSEEIDYVEAHGTGTAIGDVVEMTSIAATYCSKITSNGQFLRVGSVKSNLNHTESASGLAGLIKVALMLKKGTLVPTINVNTLNPKLRLDEKGLKVQETCEPWAKEDNSRRVAAINSFGYGGTNVHAILQDCRRRVNGHPKCVPREAFVLTLSARSKSALRKMATEHALWLGKHPEYEEIRGDVCWSLNERRSNHQYRLSLVFDTLQNAADQLAMFGSNKPGWEAHVSQGEASIHKSSIVYVFGGQGANWSGMGKQLMSCEPLFREIIGSISTKIKSLGETWSLEDELLSQEDSGNLHGNLIGQPATFAVQYATAKLLDSWGLCPSAVVGHSLGEVTAACVAGALTLEEALKIVLVRSKCHEQCPSGGAMAALGMSKGDALQLIEHLQVDNSVSIAAVNDGESVTVSGDGEAIESLGFHLQQSGNPTFWKILSTPRAFHSFHMGAVKKDFHAQMKSLHLDPRQETIPLYSTVTGDRISAKSMDVSHWWGNFRKPVQFWEAMKNVLKDGYKIALEIGAQPTLGHYIGKIANQELNSSQSNSIVFLPTHPRKSVKDQYKMFLQNTVGRLYTMGYPVSWASVQGEGNAHLLRSTPYPWQEKEYWYKEDATSQMIDAQQHAFLANVRSTPNFSGLQSWDVEIDLHRFPTLKDHALMQGGPVLPGSACVEMAIAMAIEKFCCDGVEVKNVQFTNILTLPENQVRLLRLQIQDGRQACAAEFRVKSIPSGGGAEILLAKGEVCADVGEGKLRRKDRKAGFKGVEQIPISADVAFLTDMAAGMKPVALQDFRRLTESYGFNFGPSFSLIKKIWRGDEEALCVIEIDSEEVIHEMNSYVVHPAFLDACFQTSAAVDVLEDLEDGKAMPTTFPIEIKKLVLFECDIPRKTYCHVSKHSHGNRTSYNINLMDTKGKVILKVVGFQSTEIRSLIRSQMLDKVAYQIKWIESALENEAAKEEHRGKEVVLVFKDSQGTGGLFSKMLKRTGANVVEVEVPRTAKWKETFTSAIASVMSAEYAKVQVLNFLPMDATLRPASFEEAEHSQTLAFVSCLHVLQAIQESSLESPHLVFVTQCSQMISPGMDSHFPWASSVAGLRRTAALEAPNVRCTVVDLSEGSADLTLLLQELHATTSENEIAYRNGKRFVSRIVRLDSSASPVEAQERNHHLPLHIAVHPKTKEICFKRDTWPRLPNGSLHVDVSRTWIADKSLVDALSDGAFLGFSGKVREIATDVVGINVGDQVCGMAVTSKIANQIQVNADQVILKPKEMSDEQAASLPIALSVALYVVERTVNGRKDMCLLLQDTETCLGFLASLVAKALGHKVVHTSQEQAIFHKERSKDAWPNTILLDSSKQMSDVDAAIFFSRLPNKVTQKVCHSLNKGAKLVVMCDDKNQSIAIPSARSIMYESVSFTEIFRTPAAFPTLWRTVQQLMVSAGHAEEILRIPQRNADIVSASRSAEEESCFNSLENNLAFPSFTSISFTHDGPAPLTVLPPGPDQRGLKPDRTYMVVGGIRGFGFEVARWMAESGAKTIVLVARSRPSESKLHDVSQLERMTGAKIILHQGDASSAESMSALAQKLDTLPSLAGIVHTAMVLKDELIQDLSIANFELVAAPKVQGAYLLHEMSMSMDLDFFVLFSSIASMLGNAGQASYAAANAFMDGLALYRRHVLGLPALSINWGPIKGTGVLEREEKIAEHLSRAGYFLLPATQAIEHMEKILHLESDKAQIGVFDVDWQQIQKGSAEFARSTRFAEIRSGGSPEKLRDLQDLGPRILLEKDPRKQLELVQQYVTDLMCSWTDTSPSDIDFNSSLYNYGMDSFVGLTFKMQIESSLQLSFEVFYFTQPETTPSKLVQDITGRLGSENAPTRTESPEVRQLEEPTPTGNPPNDDGARRKPPVEEIYPVDAVSNMATYQLMPLFKPEQAEVKLFCVHPAGRYIANLVPISNGFTHQSTIAFYAIGYTEPTMKADNRSVRQLAQSYVRMTKEIQRHGPYYLAGQSFGGLVAFEMANILTEQGEEVAFVGMIDTFPWYLPNRTGAARLELLFNGSKLEKLMHGLFEATFEQVLSKMAVNSLSMSTEEYKHLREGETLDNTMQCLQQIALDKRIPLHDLRELRASVSHDNHVATQKHREWKPPQVRFKGPLTFLKSADQRYTPTRPLQEGSDAAWSLLVDGNISVYICPGDHLALSEPGDAVVVGRILASAVAIRYRALCPNFLRLPRTSKQQRVMRKFEEGVGVLLHSKKGFKDPWVGTLYLDPMKNSVTFRRHDGSPGHARRNFHETTISFKELRNVLPAKHEPNAVKHVTKLYQARQPQISINLERMTSVFTANRTFNFEWHNFQNMREFFSVLESLLGVSSFV